MPSSYIASYKLSDRSLAWPLARGCRSQNGGDEFPDFSRSTKALLDEAARFVAGATVSAECEHQLRRALCDKGTGPTHALMALIGRAIDGVVGLRSQRTKWWNEREFDEAVRLAMAAFELLRPRPRAGAEPPDSGEPLSERSIQFAVESSVREVQTIDAAAVPFEKQTPDQRWLTLLRQDLGPLVDRVLVWGLSAQEARRLREGLDPVISRTANAHQKGRQGTAEPGGSGAAARIANAAFGRRVQREGTIMKGNITRRGERSWAGSSTSGRAPSSGKRLFRLVTVHGTKREAEAELVRQLAALDGGTDVEPSKSTVERYLRAWINTAEAVAVSPKTGERYRQFVEQQIIPHLGSLPLQKLRPAHVATWHGALLKGGGKMAGRWPRALSGTRTGCCTRRWRTPAAAN